MKNFKKIVSSVTALALSATMLAGFGTVASAANTASIAADATYINECNADTNYHDAGVLYANQSQISAGLFKGMLSTFGGTDVTLVKFDVSDYLGKITSAKLKFDAVCTVAGKNSDIKVASIGTDWEPSTITWSSQAEVQTAVELGTVGNSKSTQSTLEYDLTSNVRSDEDGVIAYGLYTYTGRQQQLFDISLEIEYSDEVITTTDITVNNVVGDKVIASYTVSADIGLPYNATAAQKGCKLIDGVLYVMSANAITTIDSVAEGDVLDIEFEAVDHFIYEGFEDITDTWGFTTTSGVALKEAESNKYLTLCNTNGSKNTDTKAFEGKVLSQPAVNISFKWGADTDFTNTNGGRFSYFALTDKSGTVIFAIGAATNKAGQAWKQLISYGFDDNYGGYTQLTQVDNNFYTIDLQADFANGKLSGTITNSEGTVAASFSDVDLTASNLAGLKAVNVESLSPMKIDDFMVLRGDLYDVTFEVKDTAGAAVAGATVEAGGVSAVTDADGKATISLPNGSYSADITCSLYAPATTGVVVDSAAQNVPITLTYLGVQTPSSVEISGGAESIYKPAEGTNTIPAFSAVVKDAAGYAIDNDSVTWSITNALDGISISEDGVVSVTSQAALTDDNGIDLVVRAASTTDPTVYADTKVHVYNTARVADFSIGGPLAVKDGASVQYTIKDVKDQYGNDTDYTEAVFSVSDAKAAFDGAVLTPNLGISTESALTVTAVVDGVTKTKDITVYGYDYYEPGRGEASYGEPRMAEVNGENVVVFPGLYDASAETTITLPDPVELTPGSAKKISFKNTWQENTVYTAYRNLVFKNSNGAEVLKITFTGVNIVVDAYKDDKGKVVGTQIGTMGAAGEETEAVFILKTDADGNTIAALQYNGTSIEKDLGANLGDIASYTMHDDKGCPATRLITLTDLKISDSDVAEVEVRGADNAARISGTTAKIQYTASIFSVSEGETFAWSVSDAQGVTISEDGVLSVEESAVPETVVTVTYTSNLDPEKTNSKQVTIKDYAAVKSFDFDGPIAVDAAQTAKYTVSNIVDEYDVNAALPVSYEIASGADVASISSDGTLTPLTQKAAVAQEDAVRISAVYENGVLKSMTQTEVKAGETVDLTSGENEKVFVWKSLYGMKPADLDITTVSASGEVVVKAVVGNPQKTSEKTITVTVGKFYEAGTVSGDTTTVDVTKIANYSADTQYRVTVLNNDGTYTQTETASENGTVTVNTANASKYEVSPIYTVSDVGDASKGVELALVEGLYDVTVKKSQKERGDLTVNGYIVGNNVDQSSAGRTRAGSLYTANDVKITGGKAVLAMEGYAAGGQYVDYFTVKKAPSILERKQHVYVLGDSLVANYYGDFTVETEAQTGWGEVIDKFIVDSVNVTNLAESGNYAQGLYDTVFKTVIQCAQPGDLLVFECGYNDRNYPASLGSEAVRYENMQNYMERVYNEATAAGIDVVFVTPNASVHGTGWKASVQGTDSVIAKAQELGASCFNLSGTSFAYMEPLGTTYCAANINVGDKLHSTYYGAMIFAGMVADGLAELGYSDIIDANASYTITDADGATTTVPVR
ncbi:MAG: DNRLRE domain-containing protein [Clostridiales bacterium]|nr:DNRLRE domain-containing protein [Clostridiales bacterium]